MRQNRIGSFDTLRGLAALAVCLLHSTPVFGLQKFVPHAYIVVDFFFCLSGYILVTRYKHLIAGDGHGPGIGFRHFSVIRLARLYPLYAIALILGAGYTILRLATTGKFDGHLGLVGGAFAAAVFVLPWFDTSKILHAESAAFPYVTQSWSLFWELIASGLFYYWARSGKTRTVVMSAIAGLAAIIVLALHEKTLDGGWQIFNFWSGGARALFSVSLGIVLANSQIIERCKQDATAARWLNILGYSAFALAALYIVCGIDANLWIEMAIVAVAFPATIVAFSNTDNRLLSNRVGNWLGEISYSVYLLHGTFIIVILTVMGRYHFIHAGIPTGVVCVASILFVSTFVRRWIELPAQTWLKSRLARRVSARAESRRAAAAPIGLADVEKP